MNVVINIVAIGVSVLMLAIPLINRHVFHTVNIDALVVEGRERLAKVQELQRDTKYNEAIDTAQAIINDFSTDSLLFYANDITDWPRVKKIITGESQASYSGLIVNDLGEDEVAEFRKIEKGDLPYALKSKFLGVLNSYCGDDRFYSMVQDSFDIQKFGALRTSLKSLTDAGLLSADENGRYQPKDKLTVDEKNRLKRFHVLIVEKALYPQFIRKDLNRGKDWASEFIVQTAMYYIGQSYQFIPNLDDAVATWNRLVAKYPQSIYAEVLFLEIGRALLKDGQQMMANGQAAPAEARFHEAIQYFEKIERNREIATEFPKYKYVDLEPGTYVNVDLQSRAKARVREKIDIYTTDQAKQDLAGTSNDDKSGYILEDAVKAIGETYLALGVADSARMQFQILLKFFPESDNLDDAQLLIADSYAKDGDNISQKDGGKGAAVHGKAAENYELAVKEYLKFTNVYPQSDLISKAFISLGDAYNKLGKADDANRAFASALGRAKEAEEQAKVQLQIGNYYFDRKRYSEAIAAYEIILKNFLSTEVAPNAQYLLGECYQGMGDTVKAMDNYKIILEHYRSSTFMANSANKIGNFYFDKGNYKEARDAYSTGFNFDRKGILAPRLKLQLGMIWKKIADGQEGAEKEKTLNEAIIEFKIITKEFTGEEADQANYQIAECYILMGKDKAAREAAKKVENRDLKVKTLKLIGIDASNYEEEAKYWDQVFADATEDEERSSALYEKAMVLGDKIGNYPEALAVFEQALALTAKTPKIINTKVGIAKTYGSMKKFAEAESVYADLVGDRKVNEELRQSLQIQMYDAQYKAKNVDKAFEGFESFTAQYPEHKLAPLAFYRQGVIFAEKKESEKAMEKYQTVLDKYPSSDIYDKAVLGIGEQKIALGKFKEAVEYLESFLKDRPDAPSAPNMLVKIGETYAKNLDKKEAALKVFDKVLKDYKENSMLSYAAYQHGILQKEFGREKEAVASFELVKKEDKGIYRAAQAEIGKIIAKTDPEKAIENYTRIVSESESAEDSAIAMIGIGDVYVSIKKWGDAAAVYDKVYKGYTGVDTNLHAGSLIKMADAHLNGKKYIDAIAACEEMQKRFPDNDMTINTYYFQAASYFALERFAQARKVLEKVIELNKSEMLTEIAYYQLGDSYYFAKDYRSSIPKYEEYVRKYPKGKFAGRSVYMQGTAYVTMEQFDKAKAKLQQVVSNYPDFDEICVAKNYLAYSMNKLDQWKPAVELYNEVLRNKACGQAALTFAREQREAIITAH